MNWLKRIFNWKKAPRAINEMKPVDMSKYTIDYDPVDYLDVKLRVFVHYEYWKITKKWHQSAKKHYVWIADDGNIELRKFDKPNGIEKFVGNLYTLYHQYYGKENNN